MSTIKVLIVDDQVMLRESLKFVIEQDDDIEVVGFIHSMKLELDLGSSAESI